MKRRTINIYRFIDKVLGLHFVLFFKKKQQGGRVLKKVLLIKLWGLGNLAVIWPLTYEIKEKYQGASIFFLTFDLNKGFLERNKAVNKIIYLKFTKNIFKIIWQFVNILRILRKEKIDLVINFETLNNASALFSHLTGAPLCVGLNNRYEKKLYNYWFDNDPASHISKLFASLLQPLDINSSYEYSSFREFIKITDQSNGFVKKMGDFICIHPGTSENFIGKRLAADKFCELSNMLINKYDYPLIFTGTAKEKDLIKGIMAGVSRKNGISNLAGQSNIWEFIHLLSSAFLFISNDTGPIHIASSLGINTVVFFGPTSPKKYAPLSKNSLIFYKNLECSPCIGRSYINKRCKNKLMCLDYSAKDAFVEISNWLTRVKQN
jgi:heptosyltransferase-3